MTGGRIAVAVIFLIFGGLDYCLYLYVPQEERQMILGGIIVSGVWIVALLGAIWCGLNWARCLLVGVLVFSLIGFLVMVLDMKDQNVPVPEEIFLVTGGYLLVMAALIFLPSIRELTRRTH